MSYIVRSSSNIMGNEEIREDWAISTMCWYAVFIWFGASLFSQVVYLAFYGTPYDANLMLASLGPIAWGIVVIELLVWGFVAISVGGKLFKRVSGYGTETVLSETITPQA